MPRRKVIMSQNQVDMKSTHLQDAYDALEQTLLDMLVKMLNSRTIVTLSEDTLFQWQLEKLQQLRLMNMSTIEKLVAETVNITKGQLKDIIVKQGYDFNIEANRELANLVGGPVSEWSNLDLILNQYFDSQWLDLDNHINQTLINTNYQYNPLSKAYQHVLNDTVTKTLTGFQTSEQAFKSAVYEMVEKGIASSFTDKAGREWSLERYVRTVIKSTTRRVYNDLRTERAISEYNIVTALMSSHAAARDACALIQGKFVLMVPTNEAPPEYQYLPSVYDYGWKEPAGCNGINCNHRWYSMLPTDDIGIPSPPKPKVAQENAKTVAKQRRMESSIRKAKKQLRAAELLDDKVGQEYFRNLIRKRQGALRQLIDDNKDLLHRSYGRESVHSGPSQSVIEAHRETINQDRKDFSKIVKTLGNHAPSSLEEYRQIRYNEPSKWAPLERQYKTIDEINNKNWNDGFKEKTKQAYYDFLSYGHEFSSHALSRFIQRTDISVDIASDIISQRPNYLQSDGRKVWFVDSHTFIKNKDETEFVTYVYRKNPKQDWKEMD